MVGNRLHLVGLVMMGLSLFACSTTAPTADGSSLMATIAQQLDKGALAESQKVGNPLDISLDDQDRELTPIPVHDDDPVWGPDDAPVTLIVFSDFECPFCSRHADNVRKVKEANGELVRVIFKQFPLAFHSRAMPAAQASLAALEQGKFWEVHDRLFDRTNLTVQEMQQWAADNGIDWDGINDQVANGVFEERVRRDIAEGESFGVRGTPASFINGVSVSGAVPVEELQAKIDLGLARAYVLLRSGTAPAKVYNRLVGIKDPTE
jgi:protein-disulfide isomerase